MWNKIVLVHLMCYNVFLPFLLSVMCVCQKRLQKQQKKRRVEWTSILSQSYLSELFTLFFATCYLLPFADTFQFQTHFLHMLSNSHPSIYAWVILSLGSIHVRKFGWFALMEKSYQRRSESNMSILEIQVFTTVDNCFVVQPLTIYNYGKSIYTAIIK